MRNKLIKKIILLIILTLSTNLFSGQNEIEILRCTVSEISASDFILDYSIKNTFDAGSYSALQIVLPFEKYLVQGSIDNGVVNEKDFLFSQIDIDLNGDSDLNDSFNVKIIKNKLSLENLSISPIFKTAAAYNVLTPLDETGNYNINRLTTNGIPFTLRSFSSKTPEIILGINTVDDIEFKKYSNSLLLIEVITSDRNSGEKIEIDGQPPFKGITNEKNLTGGESFFRFAAVKNIILNNSTAKGEIKIKSIGKPYSVRITYYFAISENLILLNQKIVKVN